LQVTGLAWWWIGSDYGVIRQLAKCPIELLQLKSAPDRARHKLATTADSSNAADEIKKVIGI
jgi:hypothetical protein